MAEFIVNGKKTYIHLDGFLYTKHSKGSKNTSYWIYDLTCGRIIVFATKENLRILFERSRTWYLDGTFKVTPGIFYQLFVISNQNY